MKDERANEWMNEWIKERMNRWLEDWINEEPDERMNMGKKERKIYRCINGEKGCHFPVCL